MDFIRTKKTLPTRLLLFTICAKIQVLSFSLKKSLKKSLFLHFAVLNSVLPA